MSFFNRKKNTEKANTQKAGQQVAGGKTASQKKTAAPQKTAEETAKEEALQKVLSELSAIASVTRDKTSPYGKNRIYLSAHPYELQAALAVAQNDIFRYQNCAIYFQINPNKPVSGEGLELRLAEIQLMVVIVTRRYLFEDNFAKNVELVYAMEHQIPVLPIIVDTDTEEHFAEQMNKVHEGYGNLQYLNRMDQNPSAIPYFEKLRNRLENTLLGTEMISRIKASFEAYIFLSYRKKDRVYAKQLMEEIHKIPYCRDVAIWYDEFLIPGENWNDSISEAMDKSKMVALTVTPSVIEPGNYVVKDEYPYACAANKQVIPAEFLATDRATLAKMFQGMIAPIDGHDKNSLAKAFQMFETKEKMPSPERDYLIGLAYLSGIDVERNPKYASELIHKSAEAGLPEAMEKLAKMYFNGDGVERNTEEGLRWQEKCVAAMEANPDLENTEAIEKALYDLAYFYHLMAYYKKAVEIADRLVQKAEKRNLQHMTITGLVDLRSYYAMMAKCLESVGRAKEAQSYYEDKQEIEDALLEDMTENKKEQMILDDGRIISRQDLSGEILVTDLNKAENLNRQGRYSEAEQLLRKIMLILEEKTKKDKQIVELNRELAMVYGDLGNSLYCQKKYSEAKTYILKYQALGEQLATEFGDMRGRGFWAESYQALAKLSMIEKEPNEALSCYMKGIEIMESLVKDYGGLEYYHLLLSLCGEIGDLYQQCHNLKKAEIYYQKSLEYCVKVLEIYHDKESLRHYGIALSKMGELLESRKDYANAKINYLKYYEISRQLMEEEGTPSARFNLAVAAYKLGALGKKGDGEKLNEAYQIFYKLSVEFPKIEIYKQNREIAMNTIFRLGYKLKR